MSGNNYSPNPSFEVNLSGTTFTNCAGSQAAFASPGSGNYSAEMIASGGTEMYMSQTISGLTSGNRYNASFYYYVNAVTATFSMQGIAGSYQGIRKQPNYGVWNRAWVAFTATATTQVISFQSSSINATGDTVYVDRIKVTDGDWMGAYFDGSYPYASWSGSANVSTSVCNIFAKSQTTGMFSQVENPIVANGLCLNTYAWNISNNSGRYTIPTFRGTNTTVPGQLGQTFVKNKPVDIGQYTLTMWILGSYVDGTIPQIGEAQRVFDYNFTQIMQSVMSTSIPIPLYAWQTDGSVRSCTGSLTAQVTTPTTMAGSRRMEITLVFDILQGVWADVLSTTTIGTPGGVWANNVLQMPGLVGGTVPIQNAVCTVHGPAINPRITDTNTGTWVQYNGTLGVNDVWIVDSGQWLSSVNSVSVLANTQHYGNPRFLLIDSGSIPLGVSPQVTMTCTGASTNTNLSITANRQHWVG